MWILLLHCPSMWNITFRAAPEGSTLRWSSRFRFRCVSARGRSPGEAQSKPSAPLFLLVPWAESVRDRPGKMAATDHSRSEAAKQRRQDQLQRWLGSETDRTGSEARESASGSGTRRAKVRFAQGAVFMAACSAGDREEVAALLRQGADINHANIDGLTALHQVGSCPFVSNCWKRR